jgi:hypothetical protein
MAGAAALALSAAACSATDAPPAPAAMMGAPLAPVEVKRVPAQAVMLMGDVAMPQPAPELGRIPAPPAEKADDPAPVAAKRSRHAERRAGAAVSE